MAGIGDDNVPRVEDLVTPLPLLVTSLRARAALRWEEAQRRRQTGEQLWCDGAAQPKQYALRTEVGQRRCTRHEGGRRCDRCQPQYGVKCNVNRPQSAAKPAQRTRQSHIEAAQGAGGDLHAFARRRRGNRIFD